MQEKETQASDHTVVSMNGLKEANNYAAQRTFLATMVAHFAVLLFTAFMLYTAMPGSSLFSWHPTLMTLAFVLFMTEAILMFSPQSSFFRDRKQQVRGHWLMQALTIATAIGGLVVIYLNKENAGKNHFYTWHGLLGLITVISVSLQVMAGVALLYPVLLKKFVTLAQAKIYHATFGLLNYTLVVIVLNLGLWTNWATHFITGASWYGCVACIDILALVVMTQVTNNYLPKIRRASRN